MAGMPRLPQLEVTMVLFRNRPGVWLLSHFTNTTHRVGIVVLNKRRNVAFLDKGAFQSHAIVFERLF